MPKPRETDRQNQTKLRTFCGLCLFDCSFHCSVCYPCPSLPALPNPDQVGLHNPLNRQESKGTRGAEVFSLSFDSFPKSQGLDPPKRQKPSAHPNQPSAQTKRSPRPSRERGLQVLGEGLQRALHCLLGGQGTSFEVNRGCAAGFDGFDGDDGDHGGDGGDGWWG